MMIIDEKAFYKVRDLKGLCGRQTVVKWINAGTLPAVKQGRDWIISGRELVKFLEGKNTKPQSNPQSKKQPKPKKKNEKTGS